MVELSAAAPVFVPTFLVNHKITDDHITHQNFEENKIEREKNHRQRKNHRRSKKGRTQKEKCPSKQNGQQQQQQQQQQQSSSSPQWIHVAKKGHEIEVKQRAQENEEQLLRKKSAIKLISLTTPTPTPPKTFKSIELITTPDELVTETDDVNVATNDKPRSMTKLRDRWWNLISEKQTKDVQQYLDEHNETDSKSSDTSSLAQSLADLVPFIQEEQQYHKMATTLSTALLDDYLAMDFPLHRAVMDGDEVVVKGLLALDHKAHFCSQEDLGLESLRELQSTNGTLSAIQLAVYLDRPRLLQLLLSADTYAPKDSCHQNPLMLAIELGHDTCIDVLLLSNTYLTTKSNQSGNSVLHCACQFNVSTETLKTLILRNSKLLTHKNYNDETPLHVACKYKQTHLVEIILQQATSSIRNKVLKMLDVQQQTPLLAAVRAEATDVVMTLLRWRGKVHGKIFLGLNPGKDDGKHCPLVWAVSLGSMEMIHLLLEFRDPSFFVNEALSAAICLTEFKKLELIRILINAGANPCQPTSRSNNTALSLGAIRGDPSALCVLVDSYSLYQMQNQQSRRQDPQLLNQSDFYFRAIEAREAFEFHTATTDALVKSLVMARLTDNTACLDCAVLLYQKGVPLHETGVAQLKQSIIAGKLKRAAEVSADVFLLIYETVYVQPGLPDTISLNSTANHWSSLRFWSNGLLHSDWMKSQSHGMQCSWMISETGRKRESDSNLFKSLETVILVAEGHHFVAHSQILSAKSEKLAAGIRYATMNRTLVNTAIEIDIGISAKLCMWLLQHIYHGSIVSGWESDPCNSILELALVAEEFLCTSLLLECEMRLLASNPTACYCWSCCVAVQQSNRNSEMVKMSKCLYRVHGPSQWLTANTAMNALSICQQLGSTQHMEGNYQLKIWSKSQYPQSYQSTKKAWVNFESSGRILSTPFAAVKDAAIVAILLQYAKVLKSETFLDHVRAAVEESPSEGSFIQQEHEAQIMLLQMCIDELSQSIMVPVNTVGSNQIDSVDDSYHIETKQDT